MPQSHFHYKFRKYKVPEVKWEKLCYKPWRKLIARLIKMYKLPTDVSPCLNKKRNEGALQFLLNKRFIDNSFGERFLLYILHSGLWGERRKKFEKNCISDHMPLSIYKDSPQSCIQANL